MTALNIRTRLILAYTAVFGIMLTFFALLIYQSSREAELSKLDACLQSHAAKVQTEVDEQFSENVFPNITELLALRTEGLTDVNIQILDSTGAAVLADTSLPVFPLPSVEHSLTQSITIRDIRIRQEDHRLLVTPVEVNDRNMYLLELASSRAGVDGSLRQLRLLFLITIPAVLLLASLAAYFITRSAFRPIRSMIDASRRISADNLGTRLILPKAHDEIRLLGETLNGLMERIQSAFNSQRQFVADASHELRTPLTVICSELEFARKRTADDQVKESLNIALAEIDRLGNMTRGLLMLSKLDSTGPGLQRELFRLDELVVESVQLLKTLFVQKRIEPHLQIDEAVEISGDRDKLKSALLNVLDNAIRHSPPGGNVFVSLAMTGPAPKSVHIIIEDSGAGIAPADIPHIFNRFYRSATSRAESPGSGLGLAIVEQVLKMHGGTVGVRNAEGKGASFVMELPL